MNIFYCPSEDTACPYYNERSGLCALGDNAWKECDDAYALVGAEEEAKLEAENRYLWGGDVFAVYDPD